MTGNPVRVPPAGKPGTEDDNDPHPDKPESGTNLFDLPALNSMRRTPPPSRPYGRYAAGLRPSLDTDAYCDAPTQDQEAPKTNKSRRSRGLDRPRSFRNDLRKYAGCGHMR